MHSIKIFSIFREVAIKIIIFQVHVPLRVIYQSLFDLIYSVGTWDLLIYCPETNNSSIIVMIARQGGRELVSQNSKHKFLRLGLLPATPCHILRQLTSCKNKL